MLLCPYPAFTDPLEIGLTEPIALRSFLIAVSEVVEERLRPSRLLLVDEIRRGCRYVRAWRLMDSVDQPIDHKHLRADVPGLWEGVKKLDEGSVCPATVDAMALV
jgi:hypothetical protein